MVFQSSIMLHFCNILLSNLPCPIALYLDHVKKWWSKMLEDECWQANFECFKWNIMLILGGIDMRLL